MRAGLARSREDREGGGNTKARRTRRITIEWMDRGDTGGRKIVDDRREGPRIGGPPASSRPLATSRPPVWMPAGCRRSWGITGFQPARGKVQRGCRPDAGGPGGAPAACAPGESGAAAASAPHSGGRLPILPIHVAGRSAMDIHALRTKDPAPLRGPRGLRVEDKHDAHEGHQGERGPGACAMTFRWKTSCAEIRHVCWKMLTSGSATFSLRLRVHLPSQYPFPGAPRPVPNAFPEPAQRAIGP